MYRIIALIVVILFCGCVALVSTASAAEYYVATDGTPEGDGSEENPLDIFTAIGGDSPAEPGDRIYLMPGRYDGPMDGNQRIPFEPAIDGAEGNPIVIQPAPGASPWNAPHLNGTISIGRSYLHVVGLEIGDLQWDRFGQRHQNNSALHVHGGENSKVINCNFFGGRMGSGVWRQGVNFEMYGCFIHDFGTMSMNLTGRGHGHAVYTQNVEGTKHFEHNMFYRGCGWNFDVYTQNSDVDGYDVLENISFIAGYYMPGQVSFNFGISGFQSSDRIRFIRNVAYQPRDGQVWRGNFRLIVHRHSDVAHGTGLVEDNYIMGAWRGMGFGRWEDLTVTGNTVWSSGIMNEIASAPGGSGINAPDLGKPPLENYHVDNNTYIDNGYEKPFLYGDGVENARPPFDGEDMTFAEWQALGLDTNSELIAGRDGRPTGTKVFVFPNRHEDGRAHVAVFNWDDHEAVEVDLSEVLREGGAYRVYNVLDFGGTIRDAVPVAQGQYDGGEVLLPMRGADYCPDFDAFLVLSE